MGIRQELKKTALYKRYKINWINGHKKEYSSLCYRNVYGRELNWENPQLFDEKLNVLNIALYQNMPEAVLCADKYRVREYIHGKGLGHILNELYGVWDKAKDIDVEKLPDSFALKRNGDAGGVLVVADKSKEHDLPQCIKELERNRNPYYGVFHGEYHYQNIQPRLICEAYLGNKDGSLPCDYKFYCMNGKARAALVILDRKLRAGEGSDIRYVVDPDYHFLDIRSDLKEADKPGIEEKKPENWDGMRTVAEKLAGDFPFVRVDLYNIDRRIIFGEMTFTPMGCRNYNLTEEGQKLFGDWLDVSEYVSACK